MDSIELRQKLHHYIENAEDKKLQEIFTMVEDEIQQTYNHWNNEDFVNELYEREQAYLNGTAKTYTEGESASHAREAINKQKK
jgi:septum formation inhibitor MinC